MRIISPFPTSMTAIVVTAKGAATYVVNDEVFVDVPYEDPWAQGVQAGRVQVPVGELEEGCFVLASDVVETTDGGNDLVSLKVQADFPSNRFAP